MDPEAIKASLKDGVLEVRLGKAAQADVEIRWPDASVQTFEKVKANQFLKLVHEAKANGVKR